MRKLGVKPTIEEQIKEFKKNEATRRKSIRFDGNLGALSMIKPVRGLRAGNIHFIPEEGYNRLKEINDIFKNCLSAVTTNRVGTQNAFELQMIEHLEDLINLNDDEVEDEINEEFLESGDFNLHFSRASKALEGASRIYGFRVEAIYDRAFNFISHMSGKGGTCEGIGEIEEDEDDEAVRLAKEEREKKELEEKERKEKEMKEKQRLEKEEEERQKLMARIKTEAEGTDIDDDILKGEEESELRKTEEEKKKRQAAKEGGFEKEENGNENDITEIEELKLLNRKIKPEECSYFNRKKKKFYLGESGASLAKRSELDLEDLALTNIAVDTFFLKVNNIFDHSSAEFYLLPNLELDDDFSLQFDGDVEICEYKKRQTAAKLEKERLKKQGKRGYLSSDDGDSDLENNIVLKKKKTRKNKQGKKEDDITAGLGDFSTFKKRRKKLLKTESANFLDSVEVTEEDTEKEGEKEGEGEKGKGKHKEETAEAKKKRRLYLNNRKFTANYKKKVYMNFQKLANDFFKEDLDEAFEEAVADIRYRADELKEKTEEEMNKNDTKDSELTYIAKNIVSTFMEEQMRLEEEEEKEEEHELGPFKWKTEQFSTLDIDSEKTDEQKIKIIEENVYDDIINEFVETMKEEHMEEDDNILVTNYSEELTNSDDSDAVTYKERNHDFNIKNVVANEPPKPEAPEKIENAMDIDLFEKSSEVSWVDELDGISETEPTIRVTIKEDETGTVDVEVKNEFGIDMVIETGEVNEKQFNAEIDEQLIKQLQLIDEVDLEYECDAETKDTGKKKTTMEEVETNGELSLPAEEDKENKNKMEKEKEKEKAPLYPCSDTESQCISDDSLWNLNTSLRNKLEKKIGNEKLLSILMSENPMDSDSSSNFMDYKWNQNEATSECSLEKDDDDEADEEEQEQEQEGEGGDEDVEEEQERQEENEKEGYSIKPLNRIDEEDTEDEEKRRAQKIAEILVKKEQMDKEVEEEKDEEECKTLDTNERGDEEESDDDDEEVVGGEGESYREEETDAYEEVNVKDLETCDEKEEGEEDIIEERFLREGEEVEADDQEVEEYVLEEEEAETEADDVDDELESEAIDEILQDYNIDALKVEIEKFEKHINFDIDTEEENKADARCVEDGVEKTKKRNQVVAKTQEKEDYDERNGVECTDDDAIYDYEDEAEMVKDKDEDDNEEDENENEKDEEEEEGDDEEKKEREEEKEEEEEDEDIGIMNTISFLEICPEIEYFHEELVKRETLKKKRKPRRRSSRGKRKRKRAKRKTNEELDEMKQDDDDMDALMEGYEDGKKIGTKNKKEDEFSDENEHHGKEEPLSIEDVPDMEEFSKEKAKNSEDDAFNDDQDEDTNYGGGNSKKGKRDIRDEEEEEEEYDDYDEEEHMNEEQQNKEEKNNQEILEEIRKQKMSVKEEQNFRLTDTVCFSVAGNVNTSVNNTNAYNKKMLQISINEKEYKGKSEMSKNAGEEVYGLPETNEMNAYSDTQNDLGYSVMDNSFNDFNNDFSNDMVNDVSSNMMQSQFQADDMGMEHVMQASAVMNNENADFNYSVPQHLQLSQHLTSGNPHYNIDNMGLPSMIKSEQKDMQSMNITMNMSMNMSMGMGTSTDKTQIVKSQIFSVKKSQLAAIPDDDILWNRNIISIDNRLRAVTYSGPGKENFQYITTNKLGVGLGFQLRDNLLPSIADMNKNQTRNKLMLSQSGVGQKKVRSPFDIGIVDFYNLHNEINDIELSTYDLWRKERKKEVSSIMMGVDMTSLVFEMDEKCVHSVNTLSDRVLKIAIQKKRSLKSKRISTYRNSVGGRIDDEGRHREGEEGEYDENYYDDDESRKRKVNIVMEDVEHDYGIEEFDDINYVDMGNFQHVYDEENIDDIPEDNAASQNVLEQVVDNSFLMETENVWLQQEHQKKRRETVNKIKAVLAEDEEDDNDDGIAGIATGPPGFNSLDGKKKKQAKNISKFVDVAKIKQILAEIVTTPKAEPEYFSIKNEGEHDIKGITDKSNSTEGAPQSRQNNNNGGTNNTGSELTKTKTETLEIEDRPQNEENRLVSYNSQDNIRTFKSLISETKSKLAGGESDGASIHMLFVCLLYTCNDKGLFLEQIPDENDFYIYNEEPTEEKSNENDSRLMLPN